MKILFVLLFVGIASCSPYFSNEHEEAWNHGQGSEETAVSFESSEVALADGESGPFLALQGHHQAPKGHHQAPRGHHQAPKGHHQAPTGHHAAGTGNKVTVRRFCMKFVPKPPNTKNLEPIEKCVIQRITHVQNHAGAQMPTSSEEETHF